VMTYEEAKGHIVAGIATALEAKGEAGPATLDDETELLGAGLAIDSLDLAVVVLQLTEATGKDPFEEGFIVFHTIRDLAKLYTD
jgi:acyl carrier protein